jgi:endonuclease YncB( thermonuclease family)
MVALLNGAARLTADAPDLYRSEQAEAQQGKKGIWGAE